MQVKFRSEAEENQVRTILCSMAFGRGGIIPNCNQSREDYLKDMLNTCNKQADHYIDLIQATNKKTKKYQSYVDTLAKIHTNIADIHTLLAS